MGVGPRSTGWGLALRVAACACVVVGIERIASAAATPARSQTTSPAAQAAPAGCSFAQAGTGSYASTLCWLDLSAYDAALASKPAGQPMTVTLPGGYTIRFNLHVSGGPVVATSFPTYNGAFLGNHGHYTGVSGRPALDQAALGTTTTATLSGITVTGPGGTPESGYAFVGADAESTDNKESITWTATTPFTLLEPVGNACNSGSRLTGVGTRAGTMPRLNREGVLRPGPQRDTKAVRSCNQDPSPSSARAFLGCGKR